MPLFVTIISVYLGLILLFLIATGALHAHANGRRLSIGWASIFRFVREWFGIAILGCLWPWGIIQPKMTQAKKQTAGPHHPVLLVPGYLMNRSSMWPLARHLQRHGWTWAIPMNHTINTPIPTMAQRLSQQVDTLCKSVDLNRSIWSAIRWERCIDGMSINSMGPVRFAASSHWARLGKEPK